MPVAVTVVAPLPITLTDDDRLAARMCGLTEAHALENKIAALNDPEKLAEAQLSPESRRVADALGVPYSKQLAWERAGALTAEEASHCARFGLDPTIYAAEKGRDVLSTAGRKA